MAKVPPPPQLTGPEWQAFNRWLLELTAILDASGGVDPSQIPGYPALQTQVAQNTADIDVNTLNIQSIASGQGGQSVSISALQTRMTAAEGNITTLAARPTLYTGSVDPTVGGGFGTGVVGDWYGRTSGGTGVWVRTGAGATQWTLIAS